MTNFYDVLGVSKESSESDIKKAYRALSLKYHPDRNPDEGAKAKFQEINSAYEVLGDASRKRQYDMELEGGIPFGGMPGNGPGDFADINSFFDMMFGGQIPGMHGGGPGIHIFHGGMPGMGGMGGMGGMPGMPFGMPPMFQQMVKPQPINKNITISLEQSYQGLTIPIEVEKWKIQNNIKVMEKENIYVTIPPGIDNNETICLRERGNVINDVAKGDVNLIFQIENHNSFKRQGMDLLYKKTISLKEALCGFSFEINHLNGKLLCLNNKTNRNIVKPNYTKVIPGMGMNRENNTGNMIIEFWVDFPNSLTEEQMNELDKIL